MRKVLSAVAAIVVFGGLAVCAWGQTEDSAFYVPKYEDPVLEEMKERLDSLQAIKDSVTAAIRKAQKERDERKKDERRELRFDVRDIAAPESPDVFEAAFHFPPVAQYRTGTCWAFGATSFLESEVARMTGRRIKLSEMYTVYHEYIEKARHYVRERGEGNLWQGSEANAVFRMMRQYGAVPEDAYSGLREGETRHDHGMLSKAFQACLKHVKDENAWDEAHVLGHVRLILDEHLGAPPQTIAYAGKSTTPAEFAEQVLKLDFDDYVGLISTSSLPFYTQGLLDVHDNWWRDSSYYNLPLDEWYAALVGAIDDGYTVVVGGDVSEPGWYGKEDISVVPSFDIPQEAIDQDAREYRFYNRTTTDDHLIHLAGRTTIGGRDWFLVKDSGRSARWGQFEGYSFMRDDYLRLKMLAYWVHRDAVAPALEAFE